MPIMDQSKTIKMDSATYDLALRVSAEIDCSFSDLVRRSLCIAAPQLLSSAFLRKISVEDVDVSNFKKR
ncbi:MAG: hypothetical protein WC124_00070 [Desulfoplanes sp.]